jgi:hypothetical protein
MLSSVTFSSDNETLVINGNSKWVVKIPIYISKKNAADKKKIIENAILDACNNYGIDCVSHENLKKLAKEVVDSFYEKARVVKHEHATPPSHPIITERYNGDYFECLINCIKKEVKGEDALPRQITYAILSGYSNDPFNLGVLAPTSTGRVIR